MNRLKEKVAIITGAAQGIGAAKARLFASEGAKVVMTDIDQEALQRTADQIIESGGEVLALVHDVSSEENWQSIVKKTVENFGAVHILVNNAGITSYKNIEEETLEGWERVQAVNTRGVFLGMKYTVPEIRKAGGGSIINVSSVFGIIGGGGEASYHASKGAVRLLTKTAAVDLAKDYIRVNSIHPGMIVTPLNTEKLSDPSALKHALEVTPWPRLGKPEDIAFGALYLACDESCFVTGSELIIDGGWTAH